MFIYDAHLRCPPTIFTCDICLRYVSATSVYECSRTISRSRAIFHFIPLRYSPATFCPLFFCPLFFRLPLFVLPLFLSAITACDMYLRYVSAMLTCDFWPVIFGLPFFTCDHNLRYLSARLSPLFRRLFIYTSHISVCHLCLRCLPAMLHSHAYIQFTCDISPAIICPRFLLSLSATPYLTRDNCRR